MQFDDFDKKIKEAAEHHHPAYEEKAWDQMEKLLDKHLPVEKDDRRRIIFLLLFLLLGGLGVYLGISKPWQQTKTGTATNNVSAPLNEKSDDSSTENSTKEKNNEPAGKSSSTKQIAEPAENETSPPENNKPVTEVTESKKTHTPVLQTQTKAEKNEKETAVSNYRIKKAKDKPGNKYLVAGTVSNQKILKNKLVSGKPKNTGEQNEAPAVNKISNQKDENISKVNSAKPTDNNNAAIPSNASVTASNDSVSKTTTTGIVKNDTAQKKEETISKKTTPKPSKQKKSAFAITFSAGPDLSAVGINNAGKLKLAYGAGLSYTFKRFTLRSGFYVAQKVYTAKGNDYHPPQHSPASYLDMIKVDADCKLYEIPVTFSYNFSESKTGNWFASAGLSSFLMKKEEYGYYYKDRVTSTNEYKDWTLKNGENHLFSILDLSAGYERKINKTLSIIAEPYIKVPMEGIGYGSINLNSAGILFTLSVKPFVKSR